jgi:[ribosomal protein S5]-alanine N-acetyltransferase
MHIELHPIRLNEPRSLDPDILAICEGTKSLYTRVGYAPPWIGYLAQLGNEVIGTCAFRSSPRAGKVEIVFVTLPQFERQGYATEMARKLVEIAHRADATVIVTARTDSADLAAARVLQKIGFKSGGRVSSSQEGEVVDWLFEANSTTKIYEQFC